MQGKTKKPTRTTTTSGGSGRKARLWLTYPARLIKRPIIWQLSQKFPLVTNIRQASVTHEIGILCLELTGRREDINAAIRWLEKTGVKVEPVEINSSNG